MGVLVYDSAASRPPLEALDPYVIMASPRSTKVDSRTLTDIEEPCACAVYSPDGKKVALSGGADGTVKIIDANTGRAARAGTLRGHQGPVNAIVWQKNGQGFVTASNDSTLKLWDANGRSTVTYKGHTAAVRDCAVHRGTVASASNDKTLILGTSKLAKSKQH